MHELYITTCLLFTGKCRAGQSRAIIHHSKICVSCSEVLIVSGGAGDQWMERLAIIGIHLHQFLRWLGDYFVTHAPSFGFGFRELYVGEREMALCFI